MLAFFIKLFMINQNNLLIKKDILFFYPHFEAIIKKDLAGC